MTKEQVIKTAPPDCPSCNGQREWDLLGEKGGVAICHFCGESTFVFFEKDKK